MRWTRLERRWEEIAPDYMIIDSIQTMYRPDMASAPGSVSQVRECASLLMRMAKTTGCAVFLVGHVTKEGAIAGPRVLEHMVDVVLYFEGDRQHEYRILRAVKNRFGSVNELGLFEMRESGMVPVENPSELLLSTRARNVPGSCVHCAIEGSRPMLVDVQALALQTAYGTPRRTTNGFDAGRLALLLAVLEKRAGVSLFNQDVYVNVAGGLELSEPAADLPLCAAVASSVRDACVPARLGGDRRGRSGGRDPRRFSGGTPPCRVRETRLHDRRHPAERTPGTSARRKACGSTAWKRWPKRWRFCSDKIEWYRTDERWALLVCGFAKIRCRGRASRVRFSIVTTLLHEEGRIYDMIKRKENDFRIVFARFRGWNRA